MGLKSLKSLTPEQALSWFPRTKIDPSSRERVSHLIGVCAIANDIAQVINLVVFGSGVQASLQRFKVGMDVRKNQYAQGALQSSMSSNK